MKFLNIVLHNAITPTFVESESKVRKVFRLDRLSVPQKIFSERER